MKQWTGLSGLLWDSRRPRRATEAICATAAMTAHASSTQAHPCAKLFPHAHGTEPRQCLRGTAESVSDTAVVIQLKLPGSHTTDNLLISLGRREDEQNPGAVKEGCDLCPGRPSKLFVPH